MRLLRSFIYWWVWWGRNVTYYYSRPLVWSVYGTGWLLAEGLAFFLPIEAPIERRTNGMYKWTGRGWKLDVNSKEFRRQARKASEAMRRAG